MIKSAFQYIPTNRISRNPLNPRKTFEVSALEELAESIKSYGVLQPIVVFRNESGFVLICGERRFRAATLSGIEKMPAIVHHDPPDKEAVLAMALIENLQRKDVDLISEASAIKNLIELYDWNYTKVAKKLGTTASFVRNRFLLTKHRDVLEVFDEGVISYSEAILIAELDDHKTRDWLLQRLMNGEIKGQKKLSSVVSRVKKIRKILASQKFLEQHIDRDTVSLDVNGLSKCNLTCSNYIKLSWIEKQHFKIDLSRIGWSEFCTQSSGSRYDKKKNARDSKVQDYHSFKLFREIPFHDGESMIWMAKGGKSCRGCKDMIQPQDFGIQSINPVCACVDSKCYDQRKSEFARRFEVLEKEKTEKIAEIDKLIVQKNDPDSIQKQNPKLTKKEVCYILSQILLLLGGERRIDSFLKNLNLYENSPSGLSDKVRYVFNKLYDEYGENELHKLLLKEMSLSYKHSSKIMTPKYFDRSSQKVELVTL